MPEPADVAMSRAGAVVHSMWVAEFDEGNVAKVDLAG